MESNVVVIGKQTAAGEIRAAVYCRVSTRSDNQENSLENQIRHYREAFSGKPGYTLTKIYYDFGKSGYKENRPGFQSMLKDAEKGKFDLLITKSITRFARNTNTVLNVTRELRNHGIGVFFELQGINTLSSAGELLMTIYASFGQAESEAARTGTQMSIQRKLDKGVPNHQLCRTFGYSRKGDGTVQPDGNAKTVMEIFEMAAGGYTVSQIKNWLNSQGVTTQNNAGFGWRTIERILKNEEYKGDFRSHRHYSDGIRHEAENRGAHSQYYFKDDHIPIVTEELWEKAQRAFEAPEHEREEKRKVSDEAYPYRKYLYCGKCGNRLMHAYRGGVNLWECSGKERYTKEFCSGVQIADKTVREWNPQERVYISPVEEKGRLVGFSRQTEAEWKEHHTRKVHHNTVPELNTQNYPYKDRIFCKYCGGPLMRYIGNNGSVTWICRNSSKNGKGACRGVRIPDERLRPLVSVRRNVYIGKEIINGSECYGYSGKPDQRD